MLAQEHQNHRASHLRGQALRSKNAVGLLLSFVTIESNTNKNQVTRGAQGLRLLANGAKVNGPEMRTQRCIS